MSGCLFFPPLLIFELPFMAALLAELGYKMITGVSKAKGNYIVHQEACDLAFRTKGGVEIGIQQKEDGSINVVCDEEELSTVEGVSKIELQQDLTQKYTRKKISTELEKHGFTIVEEEQLEDQTIKIRVRRWS